MARANSSASLRPEEEWAGIEWPLVCEVDFIDSRMASYMRSSSVTCELKALSDAAIPPIPAPAPKA